MRRVVWHVGVPKTGTTFLQSTLQENEPELQRLGVAFPGGEPKHFLAALDITDAHGGWGRDPAQVHGTWEWLCDRARRYDGVTVLSHELMAQATPDQIERAAARLEGLDVDLVLTVRDPARQAIAEWQEGIKHGRKKTFEQFRIRVLDPTEQDEHALRFRASQDLPAIFDRWGTVVPSDRLHVVVNPPGGGDPRVLLDLFCEVLGVDGSGLELSQGGANSSLGPEQIDLLRRVNVALKGRLKQPYYGNIVKKMYAQRLLADTTTTRPQLPADLHEEMAATAQRWIDLIRERGYVVHGDLEHLRPKPPASAGLHPDQVDGEESLRVAAATTAELLVEVRRLREENHDLRQRTAPARSKVRSRLGAVKRRLAR